MGPYIGLYQWIGFAKMKIGQRIVLVLTIMITLVIMYWTQIQIQTTVQCEQPAYSSVNSITIKNYSAMTYEAAILSRSRDNLVILSLVDRSCTGLAMNFWETSIEAHNIPNHLFVGSDAVVCDWLYRRNVPCFTYTQEVGLNIQF